MGKVYVARAGARGRQADDARRRRAALDTLSR